VRREKKHHRRTYCMRVCVYYNMDHSAPAAAMSLWLLYFKETGVGMSIIYTVSVCAYGIVVWRRSRGEWCIINVFLTRKNVSKNLGQKKINNKTSERYTVRFCILYENSPTTKKILSIYSDINNILYIIYDAQKNGREI